MLGVQMSSFFLSLIGMGSAFPLLIVIIFTEAWHIVGGREVGSDKNESEKRRIGESVSEKRTW